MASDPDVTASLSPYLSSTCDHNSGRPLGSDDPTDHSPYVEDIHRKTPIKGIIRKSDSLERSQSFIMSSASTFNAEPQTVNLSTTIPASNNYDPWRPQESSHQYPTLPPSSQTCTLCHASNPTVYSRIPVSNTCEPIIPDFNHTVSTSMYKTTLVPSLRRGISSNRPQMSSFVPSSSPCTDKCATSSWSSSPNTPVHGFRSKTPAQVLQHIHDTTNFISNGTLHPGTLQDSRSTNMCGSYSCETLPTGHHSNITPNSTICHSSILPAETLEYRRILDECGGTLRRREDSRMTNSRVWQ